MSKLRKHAPPTGTGFPAAGIWLKGATHVHTTNSDGELSPAEVVRRYGRLGYDFVFLTDHWKSTPAPPVSPPPLVFSAVELDLVVRGNGFHVAALGSRPVQARRKFASLAAMLRWANVQGSVLILAHPYWCGPRSEQLVRTGGFHAVEVYNTHCDATIGKGYSGTYWDDLLDAGRRVFGVATDDLHSPRWGLGGGWIMVKARSRNQAAILKAIRTGQFYATQGPEIRSLQVRGRAVRVTCSPVRRINFISNRFRGRVIQSARDELVSGEWEAPPNSTYVRIECIDRAGRTAWGNPVFFP